jgi:signal transduction histidine kinase
VGLPSEKLDRIFNAFYTTKPQGTGMGLAISRSIIEAHGGRLWATANAERGATFHFTLPAEVQQ